MKDIEIEKEKLSDIAFKKIVELIEKDILAIGKKIEAEQAFAQKLNISRPILREALQRLELEGYISRKHGVGTFVIAKTPLLSTGIEKLTSITELVKMQNYEVGTQELTKPKLVKSETLKAVLNLDKKEKIYSFERVRTSDGAPFAFDEMYLPERFIGKDFNMTEQSILLYMKNHHNVEIVSSRCTIYAENAPVYVARKLGIKRNTALQVLEQLFFDNSNNPVFIGKSRIISEILKFNLIRRK